MHGDTLDLTPQQQDTLAAWREQNHSGMQSLPGAVVDAEATLRTMALQGAATAELTDQYAEIERLRRQVAETKIACRETMQRVLSPEQLARVTVRCSELQLARHRP